MAFSESDTSKMSLMDKSDLFFYDYSIHPLFVHENYIHASPHHRSVIIEGTDKDSQTLPVFKIYVSKTSVYIVVFLHLPSITIFLS